MNFRSNIDTNLLQKEMKKERKNNSERLKWIVNTPVLDPSVFLVLKIRENNYNRWRSLLFILFILF